MPDLTPKQKEFADEYLETGNGVQSALSVYDTEDYSTAGNIASENLKKPKVQQYLENNAEQAALRVIELSKQDENLPVALNASKDILDRAGFKPVERQDITTKGQPIYGGFSRHNSDSKDIQPETEGTSSSRGDISE
jgi:phage terminase small subunit